MEDSAVYLTEAQLKARFSEILSGAMSTLPRSTYSAAPLQTGTWTGIQIFYAGTLFRYQFYVFTANI